MTKFYEITAFAENAAYHRSANFILNGDGEFTEIGKGQGREYRDETDAQGCFESHCTQEETDKFTAHTNVKFELIEKSK